MQKYKNISFEELINKININDIEIESYILDALYDYKGNNNKIYERKERIISFGIKDNFKLLDKRIFFR